MAADPPSEFASYPLDELVPLGPDHARRMFGKTGVFCEFFHEASSTPPLNYMNKA